MILQPCHYCDKYPCECFPKQVGQQVEFLGSKDEIAVLLAKFDRLCTTLPVWAMRLINGLRHEWMGAQAELEGWKAGSEAARNEYAALILRMNHRLVAEIQPYAKRCDRFSAALERIMEICQEERAPYQLQIFEIAEDALIEEESAS